MKIWIDLTNSPHVQVFAGLISELQLDHEIVLTSRPLANTIDLLELCDFQYRIVGRHYGRNKLKKMCGFFIRIWQLYCFLRKENIDIAISHSSFYSPVVSRFLGIPSIYLNDNEYAAGNSFSFIFATKIMIPEFFDVRKVCRHWVKPDKVVKYPGVKEGIYLWQCKRKGSSSFGFDNNHSGRTIFIRPEPWTAQYYSGRQNFMDNLLMGLKDMFEIVLLPRGKTQERHYRDQKFKGITVQENSMRLEDIMGRCDVFIGAGGTMTREAAVLGIPTICVYQDRLLDVDSFLIEKGLMAYEKRPNVDFIINYFEKNRKKPPDMELLQKGHRAYQLIKKTLLEYNTK